MFDWSLRSAALQPMTQQFTIKTGRFTVAWRAAALAVTATVAFLSVPAFWLRISLQVLVPVIGVAAAWMDTYPDWMERYRNSRFPLFGVLVRHQWDTTNRVAASFPGIMEMLGGLSLVILVAGPWALPLDLSGYLVAGSAALYFCWSVGRNIMIDWAWYKPTEPLTVFHKSFRLLFPFAAAAVAFLIFFSTPTRLLAPSSNNVAIAGLAAAAMLSLYPLTIHYDQALQAAQTAIDTVLKRDRILSQVHIHGLVKNPLYVLANALRNLGFLDEYEISHYFQDVQFGIEEARRTALFGGAGRSAYLPDIVETISSIFPQGNRPIIGLAPDSNVKVVKGEDYLLVRSLLLDLVTNAVKAGATEVMIEFGRDPREPSRLELKVRDDADGSVIIPEQVPARTSLAVIREFLSSATQGPGSLNLSESKDGHKSVIATWISSDMNGGSS
jgi:hypothetical protein